MAAASASAVVRSGSTGCVTAGTLVVPASVVARTGSMAASVASTSTTLPSTAGVVWKKALPSGRLTLASTGWRAMVAAMTETRLRARSRS